MDPTGGQNPSNPRLDNYNNQPQSSASGVSAPTIPTPSSELGAAPQQPQNYAPQAGQQPMQQPNNMFNPPSPNQQMMPQQGSIAPVQGMNTNKKDPKETIKKVVAVVGVLLVAGALFAAGYFVGLANGKTQGRQQADAAYQAEQARAQQEAAENGDPSDDPELNKLQLADLVEPKYVDETIEGEIGDQLSASDGFVLKVLNIERNFQADDQNYKLDSSKELVKINFLVGNLASDKPKDITSSGINFRLEDSTGARLVPENIADYEGKFDTIKIDPGAQASGSIVYAVNKDEAPLLFIREQRYRITSENREVTSMIIVTVAE